MSEKMGRKMPESAYSKAKRIADETMDAIHALKYKTPSGRTISLDKLVTPAVRQSKLFKPDWNEEITAKENGTPKVSVTRESTLEAAYRLSDDNVCVLNFASAKHPGGGFLRGAIAQEESLARSSALYHTLIEHPEFYEENKRSCRHSPGIYTDYVIHSPEVPVIRNDRGDWLEDPYTMSVITSPAPNRTAIAESFLEELDGEKISEEQDKKIAEIFYNRMLHVLKLMAANGHRSIVLGAWGCGIFGNDPWKVAKMFREALKVCPYFDEVVFAIYDSPDSETYKAFEKVFAS
jgi:uncharacterized protein (TIGR02452 family)